MIKVLVELDDDTAAKLERVAPSRVRRRSEFIRTALRRALWDLEEQATAQAYQRQPDAGRDVYVDPSIWEPARRGTRRKVQR